MIIIDSIAFYLQRSGGVSVVWAELLNRLNKDNCIEVEYIEYNKKPSNIFYDLIDFGTNKIHILKSYYLKVQRYIPISASFIDKKHIFHSTYYRYSTNKNAINFTTVHDFTYEYFSKGLAAKVHFWQKESAILNSEYIICISENTKKDLLKFIPEVDPSKLHVIYNGVSDDYYILPDSESILTHPIEKWKYILFVGARGGYKNFDFAVDSIATTQYKLVVVGAPLSIEEEGRLKQKLGDNFYYAGRTSNKELNTLYNNAYALFYPSSYEGFGIPVIEAQRAGCPVIAYNSSSIPEVIGDQSLLMRELNLTEFDKCISTLTNAQTRADIISMGLKNSLRFSWNATYTQLSELYKQALVK